MKIILALSLFLPTLALAENDFAAFKSERLAEIDERIQKMQEHKNCVSAAADKEAMMKCREQMKDFRQGERMENMEKRKGRMEKRMKRMQEKQGE